MRIYWGYNGYEKTHVMFFLVSITGVLTNNHGNHGSLWMVCVQKWCFLCNM